MRRQAGFLRRGGLKRVAPGARGQAGFGGGAGWCAGGSGRGGSLPHTSPS